MVAFGLRRAGYVVSEAEDSRSARLAIANERPDLALIDWMLPDHTGIELTRQLRREPSTRELPIILLTARVAEKDRVAGLESGADDYVTKPFSPRELQARIAALLRRTAPAGETGLLRFGTLELDRAAHRVSVAGAPVALGPTEFRLLEFLLLNPERVFSREQLLDRVWGANVYIEERTIDVHVRRLRKNLQSSGAAGYVQTVRGAGYRLSLLPTG